MNAALIRTVWQRANGRCEYCQMPQELDPTPFEIDHIISEKHKGPTNIINTCLSCFNCNSFKGSDIASRDEATRRLTPLFHPRRQKWSRHFGWEGPYLAGRTTIGRVTAELLRINDPFRTLFAQHHRIFDTSRSTRQVSIPIRPSRKRERRFLWPMREFERSS